MTLASLLQPLRPQTTELEPARPRGMQLRLHSRGFDRSMTLDSCLAATEAADERARAAEVEKNAASTAFEDV